MRSILIMTCAALLMGGTTVATIATGQTAAVDPPANAAPDTTTADRSDPDPGGDVVAVPQTPATAATAAATPAAPVDTRAVTQQEMSVAAEEAAFDSSLSAMAAQLDGHLNGIPQPTDGTPATAPTVSQTPPPPPLAAIVTAVICVIAAAAALALIVRSGLRARKKQREEDSQRRRALRRSRRPRTPESGAPSA